MPGPAAAGRFPAARRVVEDGLAARFFPAAAVEVGTADGPRWREAFGRLTYADDAPPATPDTIFDLASLTKVLSTTALVLRDVDDTLGLDGLLADYLPRWRGADRAGATVRDALAHCTGLPAHRSLYRSLTGGDAFERAICETPLACPPRTRAIYSDLGFILLGRILEHPAPLAGRFDALVREMGITAPLRFCPPEAWRAHVAPTEEERWRGRLLVAEVHDRNAYALGGAAGHAGLFGTVEAVGAYARRVLAVLGGVPGAFDRSRLETFVARREDVPGSSRALGWDTMVPGASCGSRLSPRAFGHTGFTGTSLWIDPGRGIYVALLTNRVHPTAHGATLAEFRPLFHDAVVADLDA